MSQPPNNRARSGSDDDRDEHRDDGELQLNDEPDRDGDEHGEEKNLQAPDAPSAEAIAPNPAERGTARCALDTDDALIVGSSDAWRGSRNWSISSE